MDTVAILKAILLGIIEGITEWLPISSTGHLILLDEFLKLDVSEEFKEMFFVVIQLGAIIAVIVSYWKKLLPLSVGEKLHLKMDTLFLWGKILAACVPAAVIGFLFDDQIDALFYNYQTVFSTLILYGVLFIIIESRHKDQAAKIGDVSQFDYRTAMYIGIFQVLALIPGTSRSGATIIGAMMFGASRAAATEFTFYLAIPVMLGASLFKAAKFRFPIASTEIITLSVGTIAAFIVSMLVIRYLMTYIKKHSFKVFGWYRIILGVILALYFLV